MQLLRGHIFSLIGFAVLIFAVGRMASNMGDNRNLLAASAIILLLSATRASWALLLRIAEMKVAGPVG
jgi:hypothetical protein